ncbi:MAG: hypothetical protein M1836_006946 [Candelina mexicana]|nr:MAG: hypothetical protein M1836_006946 [Candelina mexicana]
MAATAKYIPLQAEIDDGGNIHNESLRAPQSPRSKQHYSYHLLILTIYTLVFVAAYIHLSRNQEATCIRKLSSYSPALDAVHYKDTILDARVFGSKSKYKGAPSAALDEAWDDISLVEGFILPASDLPKVRKGEDAVAAEGGYFAVLEVYHQLHCLNMLRKATYPNHYPVPFSAHETRVHLDHCIDYLRLALQCHGDVSVITHHWVNGTDVPKADFSTQHKCRDFDGILAWSNANRGHWTLEEVAKWRTDDSVVLEHEP